MTGQPGSSAPFAVSACTLPSAVAITISSLPSPLRSASAGELSPERLQVEREARVQVGVVHHRHDARVLADVAEVVGDAETERHVEDLVELVPIRDRERHAH